MKLKLVLTILFPLFLFSFCRFTVQGTEKDAKHHYFDMHGNSLEKYNDIWIKLFDYYGKYLPETIFVKYIDRGSSRIDPHNHVVKISLTHLYSEPELVIAHETSHIALYRLTNGANSLKQFKFIDEGFASFMGAKITDTLEDFKVSALSVAKTYHEKNNIRFAEVQDWERFSNWPYKSNPDSYLVGASFCFFIIDKYGHPQLENLFHEIGRSKDLNLAFNKVFKKSKIDIEMEWGQYLSRVMIDPTPVIPKVTGMYPYHGAGNVPTDLNEIYVEFNKRMRGDICIGTPCDAGICYKNAYWKTRNVLAIRIENTLKHNYTYRLVLSPKKECKIKSAVGVDLPRTNWYFTTQ